VRIKRVRLLVKMGLPADDEIREALRAAARLREPAWYLGELERAQRIRDAVAHTIVRDKIRTRDLPGGTATTAEFGRAVARRVAA
jgi:hypothetical protein